MPYLLVKPNETIQDIDALQCLWYGRYSRLQGHVDRADDPQIAQGNFYIYKEAEDARASYRRGEYSGREYMSDWKIELHLSEGERENWRHRETNRLRHQEYEAVPWRALLDPAYISEDVIKAICDAENASSRYAHLSVKTPGKIAFTEDEAKGYTDRQTVLTPARYILRFHANLNIHQRCIDRFAAAVGVSSAMPALKITADPDEVETIYRNGPDSCMAGKSFEFHPSRVYATPGDLAVAYLGELDGSKVKARAVVWPERKTYYAIYGSSDKLELILKANGYERKAPQGARVPVITYNGATVMPYIDGVDSGSYTRDRKFFVLDDSGDVGCKSTNGFTAESRWGRCDRCEAEYEMDDEDSDTGHCESCESERTSCDSCGNTLYHDDDDCRSGDGGTLCDSCYDRSCIACAHCDETFNPIEFGRHARQRRNREYRSMLCENCDDNRSIQLCHRCDSWVDGDCEDCHEDDEIDTATAAQCVVPPSALFVEYRDGDEIDRNHHYALICIVTENRMWSTGAPGDFVICHMPDPQREVGTVPARVTGLGLDRILGAHERLRVLYPTTTYKIIHFHPDAIPPDSEVVYGGASQIASIEASR